MQKDARASFTFIINGRTVEVTEASPTTTLLDWLRTHGLAGSKCGCAEGELLPFLSVEV